MKKIVYLTLVLIIIALVAFLYYIGMFNSVKVEEKEVGPYKIVYQEHFGPYNKIKEVQDKVYESLKKDGIKTTKGVGIYFDDPGKVEETKLHSMGGVIINPSDYVKLKSLQDKYLIHDFIKQNAVYSSFPFENNLSIYSGIFKVYPLIFKYIKNNNYQQAPVMEIYDIPNKKIEYIIPVVK